MDFFFDQQNIHKKDIFMLGIFGRFKLPFVILCLYQISWWFFHLFALQAAERPPYKDGESLQSFVQICLCCLVISGCDGMLVDVSVPGPCDTEDLLDGVVFGAKYLGSTQIRSDKNPSTNARMSQAQEAVDRIKVILIKDGGKFCALIHPTVMIYLVL